MRTHNLPMYSTPFIGRHKEIIELEQSLGNADRRLLTLVGPGGVGKTRLAISIAQRLEPNDPSKQVFQDGIFFVPLAPLHRSTSIARAIGDSIGFEFSHDGSPHEQLLKFLSSQKMLLIMDNFEHLLDGSDLIADILSFAQDVVIIVTSRERLNLQEEWVWQVQGLSFPDTQQIDTLEEFDAVKLFVKRALQVKHDFSLNTARVSVARICQLVEGMPLAIELAASWCGTMPIETIARHIQDNLDFLATKLRNVDDRHRKIRTIFDHSWSFLKSDEQVIFARLCVFQGGFTWEAAENVATPTPTILASLVSKSFIRLNSSRYEIHELLRQYGLDKLKDLPQEFEQVQDQHLSYYAGWLHQIEEILKSSKPGHALRAIERDMPNIMIAWQRALIHSKRIETRQMLMCLALYYRMNSRFHESIEVFDTARQQFEEIDKVLYAKITFLLARSVFHQDVELARVLAQNGLAIWRKHGITGDAAYEFASARPCLFQELSTERDPYYWELHKIFTDDFETCQKNADRWGEGWALYSLGCLAKYMREFDVAYKFFSKSVTAFREANYYWAIATPLFGVERSSRLLGRFAEARKSLLEIRLINQNIGDIRGVFSSYVRLAEIDFLEGWEESFKTHVHKALQTALKVKEHDAYRDLIRMSIDVLNSTGSIRQTVQTVVEAITHSSSSINYQEFASDLSHCIVIATDDIVRWDHTQFPNLELVVDQVMDHFQRSADTIYQDANLALDEPLTSRQLEILSLLALGYTNKEIARELFITPGTVRVHVHHVCQKLDATNRTQAIANARTQGLLSHNSTK